MKKLLLLLLFFPIITEAQSRKERRAMEEARQKADQQLLANLKTHVQYLAADDLEGRRAGSKGEELAKKYICTEFEKIGLLPKGTKAYAQEFLIDQGKLIEPSTHLIINETPLKLKTEYYPLAYSPNKAATGSAAIDLKETGEPWFADVKEWLETNKSTAAFNINEAIRNEAKRVAAKGATALILYNSGTQPDNLSFNDKDDVPVVSIPIVMLTSEAFNKYLSDRSAFLDIDLNVNIKDRKRFTSNIVGYLDNNAPSTVIIGAHYDHLGFGEDGNSMEKEQALHNGADDNASGTAALIELARLLKTSGDRKNNYLFIAFTAKEMGMAGSKYWLENPTITTPVNYMINMDMIGRYDPAQKLTIGGSTTSPGWSKVLGSLKNHDLSIKMDTTTIDESDHLIFYNKEIPVLNFFTGIHTDYHKSTDVSDKINYDGELKIVHYIHNLVINSGDKGKLNFTKLAGPTLPIPARNTVSLGVIPDRNFEGAGLRIDGVSPKKLAEKIGLKAGDILLQLGDHKINEINTYLNALSRFKKGDSTSLKILRGTEEKELPLVF